MSELTSYNSERIYWAVEQVEREAGDIDDLHLDDNLFYLKSEVDKEIAELEESHKKEVGQLLMEIVELKDKRRWRKFPEEKPEWGEEVLVVDDESKQYIVRFSHDMKWISWGKMNTCESENVKYLMPLPSAPKEAK